MLGLVFYCNLKSSEYEGVMSDSVYDFTID